MPRDCVERQDFNRDFTVFIEMFDSIFYRVVLDFRCDLRRYVSLRRRFVIIIPRDRILSAR